MPVATRKEETVKYDLKTCPPDGFIVLRQLSYDEMLERRDGASKMLMEATGGSNSNPQMAVQVLNRWSNEYSFPRCIVDHNLTDSNGVPLDFSKPKLVFKHLDPRVGTEIEGYIDDLNNADEAEGNFPSAPNGSSPEETDKPKDNSDPS